MKGPRMAIVFMDPGERMEASSTFTSADESVLVNVLPTDFGVNKDGDDVRLYSCMVYARHRWQRVDIPPIQQDMYERREVACRYNLPYTEARAYAQVVAEGPDGV